MTGLPWPARTRPSLSILGVPPGFLAASPAASAAQAVNGTVSYHVPVSVDAATWGETKAGFRAE